MSLTKVTFSLINGASANVFDFGAVGDGVTDDTAAIQAAINYCQLNATPGSSTGIAKGPITLVFPPGYYKVSSPLNITAAISIVGQSNGEFSSGTRIFQTTDNDLFHLKPNASGATFQIENVTLLSTVSGSGNLINFQFNGTAAFNSSRIINCCFSNPQQMAIRLCGDDLKISGCTFDVSGFSGNCIQLGSNTSTDSASNVLISNCNFFNIPVSCVSIYNAQSVNISGCVVSQPDINSKTILFVDGLNTSAYKFYGVNIVGNTMTGVKRLFGASAATHCEFSNNLAYDCGSGVSETYNAIELINTSQNITIANNTINGAYGTKAIFNNGGTLSNITIVGNNISGSGSAVALACGPMTGKVNGNNVSGWTTVITASDFASLQYYPSGVQVATYGTSIDIDASLGDTVIISATNGTAFTINAPSNPYAGRKLTLMILNDSGGSLGTITWNSIFRLAAFSNPSNQYLQMITFDYVSNLGHWYEINRSASQIPL